MKDNNQLSVLKIFLFIALLGPLQDAFGQFEISADVRPRFEYRHGFGNLFPDNADPAAFVVQRSRLNFDYQLDNLTMAINVQDVSVWGDTRQIDPTDRNNSFSLFQAWVDYKFDGNWSTKLGRQVISYDDQRIFGELDWAMQGRFHDAALLKYTKGSFKADLGFAFSQEGTNLDGNAYLLQGAFTYKAMQFAYLKKNWEKASASLLVLNTGFQDFSDAASTVPDGVFYRQTIGSHFKLPVSIFNVIGSAYYQGGKANGTTDLSSYNLALEANYKPNNVLFGLGFEVLSGTDQDGENKNKSFFPLYGTNHKFNGFMDYFYVGNHANNVGLNDLYAKAVFKTGEKSSLLTKVHYFGANASLTNDADSYLGTEVDVVYTQTFSKAVKLNVGYSHMFASESMSLIKGGRPNDNTNNWAWAQLTITPTLFTTKQD